MLRFLAIVAFVLTPALAHAADELTLVPVPREGRSLALAPKLGATVPTSKLGASLMGGLEVGYDLPQGRDLFGVLKGARLSLAGELDYLAPAYSGSNSAVAVGDYSYQLRQHLLVLNLEGVVRYPVFGLEPYAGLGWGFYYLRAKMTAFGQSSNETQLRSGLQLRGGAAYPLASGDVFAELRYHYTGLDFLSTGVSNAGGVTFAAGYRFVF